jgi:hypothetical protein
VPRVSVACGDAAWPRRAFYMVSAIPEYMIRATLGDHPTPYRRSRRQVQSARGYAMWRLGRMATQGTGNGGRTTHQGIAGD